MNKILFSHIQNISTVFVTYIFLGLVLYFLMGDNQSNEYKAFTNLSEKFNQINFSNEREVELLKIFRDQNNSLEPTDSEIALVTEYLSNPNQYKIKNYFKFNFTEFFSVLWKSVWFYITFFLICLLTVYFSQCMGLMKFIYEHSNKSILKDKILFLFRSLIETPKNIDLWKKLGTYSIGSLIALVLSLTMFSPAYVTAYTLKIDLIGNSILTVLILSIFSNTVLVFFIQKFYLTLKTEFEKGYVHTAVMKGLSDTYLLNTAPFKIKSIFKPSRRFENHSFQHVYSNSIFRYMTILKEAVPILLTSLIIVEMALNVQGSLCYELLVHLNNLNVLSVLLIIFLIFLGLKCVELSVDLLEYKTRKKYENS